MKIKTEARKSLRTILMLFFLLFSVAPVAFVTGYSLVKYEQALDQELSQRLSGNEREINAIFADFESALRTDAETLVADRSVASSLSTNNYASARERLANWLRGRIAHRLWIWSSDGRLEIALFRDSAGEVKRLENMERGDVYLSDLTAVQSANHVFDVDLRAPTQRLGVGQAELMLFSHIKNATGRTIAYAQQVLLMDEVFLTGLKKRLGVEIVLLRPDQDRIIATQEDLVLYKVPFYTQRLSDQGSFEITLRGEPYRFLVRALKWGETQLAIGIGASKGMARAVLKNVRNTFFSVVAAVVILLIVLSLITSRILLRPLYDVLGAIQKMDPEKELASVPVNSETELGLLAESFNQMAERTYESQRSLREKVRELEKANIEIRETQARLVHTAKMASLGQLVAGVAHELNNPIGFIYSNLGVLREYSDKLLKLVQIAEKSPQDLKQEKSAADFEFIAKDLPKLISSCEDGARRTRDIVLGLRNFSRLDEAQLKEVDLHEGLENTLSLLSGEFKNRIKVVKNYGDLPKVTCYASQINQVFMNILANAAQAVGEHGEITITTRREGGDRVAIAIHDNGKGMDRDTIEKIFDPFFTTKTQGAGTGLGLSISYGIVQRHGGEILVHSSPGKGTEFTILLPVKSA